jgi:hypothetical protein
MFRESILTFLQQAFSENKILLTHKEKGGRAEWRKGRREILKLAFL